MKGKKKALTIKIVFLVLLFLSVVVLGFGTYLMFTFDNSHRSCFNRNAVVLELVNENEILAEPGEYQFFVKEYKNDLFGTKLEIVSRHKSFDREHRILLLSSTGQITYFVNLIDDDNPDHNPNDALNMISIEYSYGQNEIIDARLDSYRTTYPHFFQTYGTFTITLSVTHNSFEIVGIPGIDQEP